MNDTPDAAEFPGLPARLAERDLAPGRHHALREHLMNEIRLAEPAPGPAPRARWLRPAVLAPVATAALVAVLVAGLAVVNLGGDGPPADPPTTIGAHAGGLLERAAEAAAENDLFEHTREDQVVYTRNRVAWYVGTERFPGLEPFREQESWQQLDGTGGTVDYGGEEDGGPDRPAFGEDGYIDPWRARHVSYTVLATLPTDPDEMLAWLRERAAEPGVTPGAEDLDHTVFLIVSELSMEMLLPPDVGAALYRAAAQLPGVFVVPDAEDAAGRIGDAVAHIDKQGVRDELIFDPETFAVLGERRTVVADGELRKHTAQLERSVLDETPTLGD